MRKTALDMVYELAQRDDRVVFVGSDLGAGVLDEMKSDLPDRWFMEGVSEAHLIGMAAGLALEGHVVYVNTIATFLTRRCFDQIAVDLCLHDVDVRLLANGGGLVYAPLGPTHQAIEDLAILRSLPNMTVVAPCDADEMRRVMQASLKHRGPMYVRIAKGGDPIVSRDDVPFAIGKALPMRDGDDALLLTTGITLKLALDAAEELAAEGLECAVLHLPTVKPLDADAILAAAARTPVVVTVEEHTVLGGLGGAVAEVLGEAGLARRFRRIGIPDRFGEEYESQSALMETYGITAGRVAEAVRELAAR
jgi:transketolase